MRALLISICLLFAFQAFSYTVPVRRDLKPASQQMIEKRTITTPVVADADRLLNDQATSASATTTVTSFLADPDVCRAISITPGGTTADVPAGDIDITGTNIFGETITETLTLTANQATIENGVKAFCTVTQIVFPIQDGAAATYDFGVIDVLGLHRCLDATGHIIQATLDGTYEATRPTCVVDADEVEKNTCDINGTLDGTKDVEIFYMQNYRCLP